MDIVTIVVGPKYWRINSILPNLLGNFTHQVERVTNPDGKIKDALSHKSSNYFIKTDFRILIGNLSEVSKSVLITRGGNLDQNGPGARTKAEARRNFNKRSIFYL